MDAAAVAELFAPVVAVRTRRMFGGLGVYTGEVMFALAFDGEIFLKTMEATRPEFRASGSEPFRYMARSRERELGYWRLRRRLSTTRMRCAISLSSRLPQRARQPSIRVSGRSGDLRGVLDRVLGDGAVAAVALGLQQCIVSPLDD